MSKNRHFQRGSGCYACRTCGKLTRDVNREEGQAQLCATCYERAGDENSVSDGAMTEEQFSAKWGAK